MMGCPGCPVSMFHCEDLDGDVAGWILARCAERDEQ